MKANGACIHQIHQTMSNKETVLNRLLSTPHDYPHRTQHRDAVRYPSHSLSLKEAYLYILKGYPEGQPPNLAHIWDNCYSPQRPERLSGAISTFSLCPNMGHCYLLERSCAHIWSPGFCVSCPQDILLNLNIFGSFVFTDSTGLQQMKESSLN